MRRFARAEADLNEGLTVARLRTILVELGPEYDAAFIRTFDSEGESNTDRAQSIEIEYEAEPEDGIEVSELLISQARTFIKERLPDPKGDEDFTRMRGHDNDLGIA